MTTISANPGKKLRATINQENPQAAAVASIQQYLSAVWESKDVEQTRATMWAVSHLLCPCQRHSEAEGMAYLIKKIIAFLFHPERLASFIKTTACKPADILAALTRMSEFFDKMSTEAEEAELTLFNIVKRGEYYPAEALETERNYFQKMLAVQEAKNEVFND